MIGRTRRLLEANSLVLYPHLAIAAILNFGDEMFHPYREGYSTLPCLKKIEPADVFQHASVDRTRIAMDKMEAMKEQTCFVEHDMDPAIYKDVCDFIVYNHSWLLWKSDDFRRLGGLIPEDIIVHRLADDRDWMAAGHICFPSGWRPE